MICDAVELLANFDEESIHYVVRKSSTGNPIKIRRLNSPGRSSLLLTTPPTTSGRGQQEAQRKRAQAPKKGCTDDSPSEEGSTQAMTYEQRFLKNKHVQVQKLASERSVLAADT